MKYLIWIALTSCYIYAGITLQIYNLFNNHRYSKACNLGLSKLYNHRNDENYISIYAFSCLKAGYLDRLSYPIARLKDTPSSRANALYLSVIVMQEKLLLHSMLDGYKINHLKLPTTNYILSKVFNLYSHLKHYHKVPLYLFTDPQNKNLVYKVYVTKSEQLIVEILHGLTVKHKYIFK